MSESPYTRLSRRWHLPPPVAADDNSPRRTAGAVAASRPGCGPVVELCRDCEPSFAARSGVLEELTVAADGAGYAELVEVADRHTPLRAWAIEGTGSHGAKSTPSTRSVPDL